MVAINSKQISVQLGKISKETPQLYRAYMFKVLKTAEADVKQTQNFDGTLLVDKSPRKSPAKVNLNGQLQLIDQVDLAEVFRSAEQLFYQIAPLGETGDYRRDVRWMVRGNVVNLPLLGEHPTAILTTLSAYSRRGEFGKKETNIYQTRITKRRGRLRVKTKIKKRWFKDAPTGVFMKIAKMLQSKHKDLIKSGKIYIQFKKIKGVPGKGGLDSYPGIIIGRKTK